MSAAIKKLPTIIGVILVLVVMVAFGAWFFHRFEGWRFVDSFYFTMMTITTVGYGDLVPTHDLSKIVTSLYSVVSIPIVLFLFGVIAESYFENRMMSLESRIRTVMTQEKKVEHAIENMEKKEEAILAS